MTQPAVFQGAALRRGMAQIAPFFIVADVQRTIAFYRDRLGFETRFLGPDEDPFFAMLGRDGVQLFIKHEGGVPAMPNPTRHPHMRWDAYVFCPEPDELAAELAMLGAPFSEPLQDTHDGLRGFEVRDPDGWVMSPFWYPAFR